MKTRSGLAALLGLLLSLPLAACTTEEPGPTASQTPEDHLDLAEDAMAARPGWTFQVRGEEKLTQAEQQSEAIYSAMMERTQDPLALHVLGNVSTGKDTRGEELFVFDNTAYLRKEGSPEWKQASATDPAIANKVEDPVAALADFRGYMKKTDGVDVTLTKLAYGQQVSLRADVASRKLADAPDRPWAAKARREVQPALDRLREAGVRVNEDQLTLVSLEEELVLDSATHRILTHWFRFTVRLPSDHITYTQEVKETNRGEFRERIEVPEDIA
ncbi:hypothetical protein [Streptomyces sp. TRM70350]|uniref:hypothetical protein n=1 Tax=Streptomyces sp. TRM70350 TaxID=2856165 RepID=UPI001C4394DF|nr:hypothetical protein [Streptomyces sp. TRM70350]MBV7698879.1 hypothetical protein [Streptomyces sp. TRM70350]